MKKTPLQYRQGDVLLLAVPLRTAELEDAPADPRGLVLAEGETSGHHHVFEGAAKAFRYKADRESLVIRADGAGTMRVIGGGGGGVDRHTPIELPPLPKGMGWERRVQRAWTSGEYSARVED